MALDPAHADALHLLGILAAQSKDRAAAVELMSRAIALAPGKADYHYNLGVALQDLKRPKDALAAYDRAIALKPDYAEAHNNRGVALQELGRFEDAAAAHRRAAEIDNAFVEAHRNLGNAYKELGRFDDALAAFDRALALDPNQAEAHNDRGAALKTLGRIEEALAAYDRALALKPDYAEAHNNRGNALWDRVRAADALAAFDRALALKPDYAEAHNNRGNALLDLGRFDGALAAFDRALALKPDYAEAHNNRGNALLDLGRFDDALAAFERALALKPDYTDALWNVALGRLRVGDFARGWEGYELRQRLKLQIGGKKKTPLESVDDIADRSILLFGEQGLGDEIMFASLVPDAAKIAKRITLACEPRLTGLLARSLPGVRVIASADTPPADVERRHLMGSLGRLFRNRREDFPGTPYLIPDPARMAAMRGRLAALGSGPKLGVMWRGGAGGHKEKIRSLSLEHMAEAMDPSFHWISLSHLNTAGEEIATFAGKTGIALHHWPEILQSRDYDDTAALLAALDAVFTVTCTIGHCAGALGVPVHVLVPRAPEWRYGAAGDTIPWYRSMTLYRQAADGAWPMARVRAALAKVRQK